MSNSERCIRIGFISGAIAGCTILLAACQAPRQTSPLAHLPRYVEDFRNPQFVENHTLIVQTCLRDRKIDVRKQDIAMPSGPMPLTVCKRRESVGQLCPTAWQAGEPADAATSFSALRTVRVWEASGSATDIARRFLAVGDVQHAYVNSAGGFHTYLTDTTTRDQPVFEYAYDSRAASLFAWKVTVESVRNGVPQPVNFWFQPPADLRLNEFSDWRAADAEELISGAGRSAAVAMANNAEFPQGAVGPGSPYVRFGLLTYRQYHDGQRLYQYEFKPAQLEAAKHLVGNQREHVQILRSGGRPIPPC